ncbi:MAG: hypothetical protein V3S78_07670 [Hyphomicrobium sp.]
MLLSPEARAARKSAHLARIAAKGSANYPALYASQPAQVAKAAENAERAQALREAKATQHATEIANAQGAAEVFSGAISTAPSGE